MSRCFIDDFFKTQSRKNILKRNQTKFLHLLLKELIKNSFTKKSVSSIFIDFKSRLYYMCV